MCRERGVSGSGLSCGGRDRRGPAGCSSRGRTDHPDGHQQYGQRCHHPDIPQQLPSLTSRTLPDTHTSSDNPVHSLANGGVDTVLVISGRGLDGSWRPQCMVRGKVGNRVASGTPSPFTRVSGENTTGKQWPSASGLTSSPWGSHIQV